MTRSVMADSIWHSHRMQIEGYERSHQHNVLDGLAIQYANLVAASCDGSHDTVVVRFFVKSADYVTDDANNGKFVRGHKDLEDWCEDWVYQRSARASTNPEGGLLQPLVGPPHDPLDAPPGGARARVAERVETSAAEEHRRERAGWIAEPTRHPARLRQLGERGAVALHAAVRLLEHDARRERQRYVRRVARAEEAHEDQHALAVNGPAELHLALHVDDLPAAEAHAWLTERWPRAELLNSTFVEVLERGWPN